MSTFHKFLAVHIYHATAPATRHRARRAASMTLEGVALASVMALLFFVLAVFGDLP